jgi:hypothetical protein
MIKLIDRLKYLLDECENNPKIKSLLLKVAEMPQDKQEPTLQLIELILSGDD